MRTPVRIEAGRDDDERTTTGAAGVDRAVRIAVRTPVRIEAGGDDTTRRRRRDDACDATATRRRHDDGVNTLSEEPL